MTPYELSRTLHRELSDIAPRLSAGLNRALVDIGEGSLLVGLGPGTHRDDRITFQETETIDTRREEPSSVLARILEVTALLENHSSWTLLVDKKSSGKDQLELVYTFVRESKRESCW